MKILLIVLSIILISTTCQAEESKYFAKWSKQDYIMEATWVTLHLLDWGTTLDIAARPKEYREVSGAWILGSHPSRSKVNLVMGLAIPLHIGIVHALSKNWRPWFQGITIGNTGFCVGNNFAIGLHFRLP